MNDKGPDAFRTISEVAEELAVPQHVLRFWETRFSQIKPMKRGGGRRYYRPDDIDLIKGIKSFLYDQGYTIKGVQKILKDQGVKFVSHGTVDDAVVNDNSAETPLSVLTIEPSQKAPQSIQSVSDGVDDDTVQSADLPAGILSSGNVRPIQREPSGFLSRLLPDVQNEQSATVLTEENRVRLQSTLYELLECKKLLDSVRG